MSKNEADAGIRLQVYLARCGLGSRRSCESIIMHRRVTLNGVPVTRMGEKVLLQDVVTVDGRTVTPSSKKIYIALHKPRGYICANADPEGRPLASSLFTSAIKERLFHVGRLDFLSTGLILYTNDGEFSKIVSHPRSRIEKEYLVETGREVEDGFLRQYAKGIRVGDVTYRCKSFVLRGPHSALITLLEGKNRELRNVFTSRNIRLKRVHRLRIGPLTLRGIPPGHFRRLTEREVRWFFDQGTLPTQGRSIETATRPQTMSSPGAARKAPSGTIRSPGANRDRAPGARGAARPPGKRSSERERSPGRGRPPGARSPRPTRGTPTKRPRKTPPGAAG